jgi:hypothetical protein
MALDDVEVKLVQLNSEEAKLRSSRAGCSYGVLRISTRSRPAQSHRKVDDGG